MSVLSEGISQQGILHNAILQENRGHQELKCHRCGYRAMQVTLFLAHDDAFCGVKLPNIIVPKNQMAISENVSGNKNSLSRAVNGEFELPETLRNRKRLVITIPLPAVTRSSVLPVPLKSATVYIAGQYGKEQEQLSRLRADLKEKTSILNDIREIWSGVEVQNNQVTELKDQIILIDKEIKKILGQGL